MRIKSRIRNKFKLQHEGRKLDEKDFPIGGKTVDMLNSPYSRVFHNWAGEGMSVPGNRKSPRQQLKDQIIVRSQPHQ